MPACEQLTFIQSDIISPINTAFKHIFYTVEISKKRIIRKL